MPERYIYASNESVPLGKKIREDKFVPQCWFEAENEAAAKETGQMIEEARFKGLTHGLERTFGVWTVRKARPGEGGPHVLDYLDAYGIKPKQLLRRVV